MKSSAKPLANLAPDAANGCFSERPIGGIVPFYGLDLVQKRAIAAALRRLGERTDLDPARELDLRMKQLNCYACHELAGTGGPETSREVYFGFRDESAVTMGREGHLPPALDGVTERLPRGQLESILSGTGGNPPIRTHLLVPMPGFRKEATAGIPELFFAPAP